MAKNIVLLSDGTGNSSKAFFKTNVWRLFQVLDLRDPEVQIAFYDDGVGTSSFRLFAILAGAFGIGLMRNVVAIYSFCCRNYEPGDRIYCFGFSRGAFTIRLVAGMIANYGLAQYNHNELDLARSATEVYRDYRRQFNFTTLRFVPSLFDVCDAVLRLWGLLTRRPKPALTPIDSVHFIGVWDTVAAYGGPIQEITRAIDHWVWPLSMPDRFMNAKVHKACHAVSLDDEREAFHPVIWDQRYVRSVDVLPGQKKTKWLFDLNYHTPSVTGRPLQVPPHQRMDLAPIDRERISQVWFAGVHADVGGGYPQNGLSYVSLDWMLDRATAYGLRILEPQRERLVVPYVDPFDKLNESRRGLAAYYRYKPRDIAEIYAEPTYKPASGRDWSYVRALLTGKPGLQEEILADLHPTMPRKVLPLPPPLMHASVFYRIKSGTDCYAPLVLPEVYGYTDKVGSVICGTHSPDQGDARIKVQDCVWDLIWLRRWNYLLTLLATIYLASIPLFVTFAPGFGLETVGEFVNPILNATASWLPGFFRPWFEPWFESYRNAPGFFLVGLSALVLFFFRGGFQERKIRDLMRIGWHSPVNFSTPVSNSFIYSVRRSGWYRACFFMAENWLVPTLVFPSLVWLVLSLAFGTANALGLFCTTTGSAISVTEVGYSDVFYTKELCHPTGLKVSHGETYRISLSIPVSDPWIDKDIRTDPRGFVSKSWMQLGLSPFKRLVLENWFRPIVRVGSTGFEEHLLTFTQDPTDETLWSGQFTARGDGEVFIYVNDTSIFFPLLYQIFYNNNRGSADIWMKKVY
jgi:uncharacterized protein (DUF2235 family)